MFFKMRWGNSPFFLRQGIINYYLNQQRDTLVFGNEHYLYDLYVYGCFFKQLKRYSKFHDEAGILIPKRQFVPQSSKLFKGNKKH